MTIAIIGAGPIGCYTAYLLAKAGKEVNIYEEHKEIGNPVQCTGIVTDEITKIIDLERSKNKIIINKVNKVIVYSKNNKTILPIHDLVLDRAKFDKYLANLAKKAGAKIHLNHKFLGIMNKKVVVVNNKDNKPKKIKAEYIIGSDGPLSEVAKSNKLFKKSQRKFYLGIQARVKGKFNKEEYETYFGSLSKNFFAWILPESKNIARIGIASKDNKKTKELFNKFLKVKNIKTSQIIDKQAGLIPIFNENIQTKQDKIFLLGDAASQVKATTGGGIVPGLKAAKIVSKCILNNNLNYEKAIKIVNNQLKIHLKIRQILSKFNDQDYNKLIKILNKKAIKKVLKNNNRDNPKKLIIKAILAEPSLLLYGFKLF